MSTTPEFKEVLDRLLTTEVARARSGDQQARLQGELTKATDENQRLHGKLSDVLGEHRRVTFELQSVRDDRNEASTPSDDLPPAAHRATV